MEKIKFDLSINAPREKVWDVLWQDDTYRKWTTPFCEGSYAVTDWKEGSKALFLSPDGQGMYSVIDKVIPNESMSIKHVGVVKDGKELPIDEETKSWSGAMENYTLKDENGRTKLSLEFDANGEHADFFKNTFPKALAIIKELSEK